MRSQNEILADIDATLDQLIANANTFFQIDVYLLEDSELEALHKTQQSLLARLIDRDRNLGKLSKMSSAHLSHKIDRFSRLHTRLVADVTKYLKKHHKQRRSRQPSSISNIS